VRNTRLAAIAGVSVAPSWLFVDHDNMSLLAALVWPVQHFTLTRDLRRLVDDMTSAAATEVKDAAAETVRRSKRTAVAEELRRLARWVDDAEGVLTAAVGANEELRREAASRLMQVRTLLEGIEVEATAVQG